MSLRNSQEAVRPDSGTGVVRRLGRDLMVVELHTRPTLVAVDIHPARGSELPEALSTGWVEAQGSLMVVRLGRAPVVMEVSTGDRKSVV